MKYVEGDAAVQEPQRRTPQGVRGLKFISHRKAPTFQKSHPARGAWIEIGRFFCSYLEALSHPARGAWIEIGRSDRYGYRRHRRTPQGVRGLKLMDDLQITISLSRTPQGVRGLKWYKCRKDHLNGGRTPQGVRGLKFHLSLLFFLQS